MAMDELNPAAPKRKYILVPIGRTATEPQLRAVEEYASSLHASVVP